MKFSVLISVYHKENPLFLADALDSIEKQTLPADEIVLVKDGPLTPELDKVIAEHAKSSKTPYNIVALEKNVGLGIALDKGLRACSYAWVARMDGDDIATPDRFEKQISYLKEHPVVDVLGSWISEFHNDPNEAITFRKPPGNHAAILAYAKYTSPVNHMSVIYRKEAVLTAESYLPDNSLEDYHLWIRMLMKGNRFANIEEFLIHARTGEGMITRRHGYRYFKNEVALAHDAYKMGFLTRYEQLRNFFLRALPRLMPHYILKKLYNQARKFTRS